jgi:multiple sugar transport system ATP-binding protein
MADLHLDAIAKRFGDTDAVADLSLTVADGEFVVLLGPTGAGKTTILRLVAGLEKPDRGTVRIGGRDVTAATPAERDVCFVFQQYSLYPHYTVYENLAFPLRAPGRRWPEDKIAKRVGEVAEILQISGKLGNRSTQLSGGEMQRVSIGRALVRSPSLFLMDEPLSSLDAKLREELRIELKRIQRDLGATVLYVTHDQIEAMTLADRIGVVSHGRLIQCGPPREIYDRPCNIEAARRLGSPQINLLPDGLLQLQHTPTNVARIGVRPEDIRIAGKGGVAARVAMVEHLGAEAVAVVDIGGEKLQVLLSGDTSLAEGDRCQVAVRDGSAMFFDAQGDRIASTGASASP